MIRKLTKWLRGLPTPTESITRPSRERVEHDLAMYRICSADYLTLMVQVVNGEWRGAGQLYRTYVTVRLIKELHGSLDGWTAERGREWLESLERQGEEHARISGG